MLIAFDLDDTLYKERQFVASGCEAVARLAASTGKLTLAEARAILADAAITAEGFDRLAEATKGDLSLSDMLNEYRFHTPVLTLPEETADLLACLKQNEHTLVLITDGRSATQRGKIKALGLERYFSPENIIISGETGADKNYPLPFLLAAERNPGETERVYVGDNPAKDFRHPNLMGWRTIQLNDTANINVHAQNIDAAPEYMAAQTINTLGELPGLL